MNARAGRAAKAAQHPIDPLVELGQMQEQLYERLRQTTPTEQPELEAMWELAARQGAEALERARKPIAQVIPEQYLVLVTCRDEKQQVELLERFLAKGLECKALLLVAGRVNRLAGPLHPSRARALTLGAG